MEFDEERQAWASQRQQMGADIMNEVYEKLRKDVTSTGVPHEQADERAEMHAAEQEEEDMGETVGSSVLRVSIGGLTATSDSMGGSFEKPTSALPWKDRKQSPRWAGLPSPQCEGDGGNPLAEMMEPEPEPEPVEVHLREQLRQSREQLRQLEQVQAAADAVAVEEEEDGDEQGFESDLHLYEKRSAPAAAFAPQSEEGLVSPSPSSSSFGSMTSSMQSPGPAGGKKKDAAFKAKLRADNERLQVRFYPK